MEYRAIYKCRMCGKRYCDILANKSTAVKIIIDLMEEGKTKEPFFPGINGAHSCSDGNFGISDFIGWEAKE